VKVGKPPLSEHTLERSQLAVHVEGHGVTVVSRGSGGRPGLF
jgi:hypothetical protein